MARRALKSQACGIAGALLLAVTVWSADAAALQYPNVTGLSSPTGGGVDLGSSTTNRATVAGEAGQPTPTGTVTFFFCKPNELTQFIGCLVGGTQIGTPTPLDQTGHATSDAAAGTTSAGLYCWRFEYSGDSFYKSAVATDLTTQCFFAGTPSELPNPIPTLSEWAAFLFVAVLIVGGVTKLRRRSIS